MDGPTLSLCLPACLPDRPTHPTSSLISWLPTITLVFHQVHQCHLHGHVILYLTHSLITQGMVKKMVGDILEEEYDDMYYSMRTKVRPWACVCACVLACLLIYVCTHPLTGHTRPP